MDNNKNKNRPVRTKAPQDKCSEQIHCKVTSRERLEIVMTAKKCGMTLSSYLRARALGYEPVARFTAEDKLLITQLAQVRSDNANLINAISGLSGEEKRKLFHNRQMMEKWYNEVRPIAEAMTHFIREVRDRKALRPRTTNDDGKEAAQ